MKFSTLLLILTLTLIAAFSALNWSVFVTPTELSLGFTTTKIPLGLTMLGLLVLLTILFLGFVFYLQASSLLETRRHTKELQSSRELADQAEASRFNELQFFLKAELVKLTNLHAESKSEINTKIELIEHNLRTTIEHSGNSLAAYIGELEDRLESIRTSSTKS
ncbi:MAG: LapA family protein [Methylotenera sp.]|uniref:LapA family protein n=1 Tax=Methylotenera sp. TaxID=2051956 RepID=UPI002487AE35|nr:LapA family protein [Methylotenera sp.]MDI1308535.1 LapA family protein [Methylotenera sp.]